MDYNGTDTARNCQLEANQQLALASHRTSSMSHWGQKGSYYWYFFRSDFSIFGLTQPKWIDIWFEKKNPGFVPFGGQFDPPLAQIWQPYGHLLSHRSNNNLKSPSIQPTTPPLTPHTPKWVNFYNVLRYISHQTTRAVWQSASLIQNTNNITNTLKNISFKNNKNVRYTHNKGKRV